MSETAGDIQSHIRDAREDLDSNLKELGEKVKSATDWRQHFQKSPGMFLTAALGAGLWLAYATSSRRSHAPRTRSLAHPEAPTRTRKEEDRLGESLEVIKGALIGLAATHAKKALSELLPGFAAHLPDSDRQKRESAAEPVRGTTATNGAAASAKHN